MGKLVTCQDYVLPGLYRLQAVSMLCLNGKDLLGWQDPEPCFVSQGVEGEKEEKQRMKYNFYWKHCFDSMLLDFVLPVYPQGGMNVKWMFLNS